MALDETITLSGTPTQTSGGARVNTVIPRRLGHVSLIRELGQGGMGIVWLARDEMLGRDVAVKFLLNAVTDADDPGFARFLEGARAAATLRHPGLTAIHAAELINGVPYQVMEFVDGPTLARVLERGGPLPKDVAHGIIDAVADAISMLHERGIVHRDIKPSNVLLDGDGRVFVTDFGLTCRRATPEAKAQVAGTPAYMAPEMFEGQVSPKSDVYALGVVLYEMLTGERPFASVRNSTAAAERGPMPRQPLAARKLPDALLEVIERALNVNPLFRHKSAANFRQAVDDAMGSRPDAVRDARAIAALVTRVEGQAEASTAASKTPGESTPTYFDSLAQIAARKRGSTPANANAERAPQQSTIEQAKPRQSVGHLATAVMALHPTGRLPDNRCIPCVSCGYDVRGQEISSRCPECGMAIVESALPDRLVFCSIPWLRRVVLGLAMVRHSVVAVMGAFALLLVSASIGVFFRDELLQWGGLVCLVIANVGPAVGVWLATAPEPGRQVSPAEMRDVWIARGAIILSGPLVWFMTPLGITSTFFGRAVMSVILGAMLLAGMMCFGRVIAGTVGRIPDASQSRRMKTDAGQISMLLGAAPAMVLLRARLGIVAPVVMILLFFAMLWFFRRLGACETSLRRVISLSGSDS